MYHGHNPFHEGVTGGSAAGQCPVLIPIASTPAQGG